MRIFVCRAIWQGNLRDRKIIERSLIEIRWHQPDLNV
jgi:hypothetical protein